MVGDFSLTLKVFTHNLTLSIRVGGTVGRSHCDDVQVCAPPPLPPVGFLFMLAGNRMGKYCEYGNRIAKNIILQFIEKYIFPQSVCFLLALLAVVIHRCVTVKSGKIILLQKIFPNKATSACFVNLSPIFTIFNILVNNDIVHRSHHFGCHGVFSILTRCVEL